MLRIILCAVITCAMAAQTAAQEESSLPETTESNQLLEEEAGEDLTELSLEELMDIEITSVSKKLEKLSRAAAAVYVVTADEIRRSGARSIPEALRLVPGVEVARISNNRWAVTTRGFNSGFANKLLVLMDGRTLYSPLFSGTLWDQQDTLMENIERIEVIRGPGATLWGENAVNGIINIITKNSEATQGGLIKSVVGTNELETAFRYGGPIGDDAFYRVYGRFVEKDGFRDAFDGDTFDDFDNRQGGFRLDWKVSSRDTLTISGDAYNGHSESESVIASPAAPFIRQLEDTISFAGANFISRWEHRFDDDSVFTFQFYYDHTERTRFIIKDLRNTVDLEAQYQFSLGDHEIVAGLNYRFVSDDTDTEIFNLDFNPADRQYQVFSAFVQDEISIVDNELSVIVGSKFSHNDFSGLEIQPSFRLVWTPDKNNTLWGAVSRAVRTPTRADHDVTVRQAAIMLPGGIPAFPLISGNDSNRSEDLLAFELGYRFVPLDGLSVDLAVFYNDYEHLRTNELQALPMPDPAGFLNLISVFDNKAKAESYGAEVSVRWRASESLQVSASYSFIDINIHGVGTADPMADSDGDSPHHRFQIRPSWNITEELRLDGALFFVDNVPAQDIPSYFRLDLQISWSPDESLELGAGVRNLLDDRHPEFRDLNGRLGSEVERTAYLWLEYRF